MNPLIPLLLTLPQGNPIPPPPAPVENPITTEKAVLGKILFWEEQLSSDDTMACGTCHHPAAGFTDSRADQHPGFDEIFGTDDDRMTSPGVLRANSLGEYEPDPVFHLLRQRTPRRTPDIFAAQYTVEAFWDGRARTVAMDPVSGAIIVANGGALESQAAGPPLGDGEMAHEFRTWNGVVQKIQNSRPLALATDLPPDVAQAINAFPTYQALFNWAFGSPGITAKRIIFAIATYERTLVHDQTPWSDYMMGNQQALTPNQVTGWNQFMSIGKCDLCHPPPLFTDNQFHNLGLRPAYEDFGRAQVTFNPSDRGQFRTPSLFSVGLRPRYFHDGSESVLWAPGPVGNEPPSVGKLYLDGGGPYRGNLSNLMFNLRGTPGLDMGAIMDFVENGLADPRLAAEQYPFDKPTLRSERIAHGTNYAGTATPTRPGVDPLRLIAHVPAYRGSQSFKVGVAGGPAGRTAYVGVSMQQGNGQVIQGAAMWIGMPIMPLLSLQLADDGFGSGCGTLQPTIPNNSGLRGRNLYLQAYMPDPLAPSGACASQAAAVLID